MGFNSGFKGLIIRKKLDQRSNRHTITNDTPGTTRTPKNIDSTYANPKKYNTKVENMETCIGFCSRV